MSPTRVSPNSGTLMGRRSLLLSGAGATLALTAGCELNNPYSTDETPASEAKADLAPDVALAVTAVGAILLAQARAQNAVKKYPALRPQMAPVIELHTAHLAALRQAVPRSVDPAPSTSSLTTAATTTAALKQQQAAEDVLQDRLIGLAVRAESGPFARLLGSMAAALAQQSAAAPFSGGGR